MDKVYWIDLYNNKQINIDCSNFCLFMIKYLNENNIKVQKILDCGCGNGRDSFELSKIYNVDAIDNNGYMPKNKINCFFYNEDFVEKNKDKYDLIYSRFTFHSITDKEQCKFLKSIKHNQYLAIETRSDKGTVENLHFGNTHYRNLTNLNKLTLILISLKFKIIYLQEKDNVAQYNNENPICIRILCKKE